jgi:transposase
LIDGDGRPVCSEMWPGNTADVITLIPVIDRLRQRFAIAHVCVVADRGLISEIAKEKAKIAMLCERSYDPLKDAVERR